MGIEDKINSTPIKKTPTLGVGGGIRRMITVKVLSNMEKTLQERL